MSNVFAEDQIISRRASPVIDFAASSEDGFEVDDFVALSGKPGLSFHKVQTGNATSQYLKQLKELRKAVAANADNACGLSESDLDHIIDFNLDELLSVDDGSSVRSPEVQLGNELEWDNDTPVKLNASGPSDFSFQQAPHWRTVRLKEMEFEYDYNLIAPYRQVLTHGGYYGEGLNAIVVFSACFLPDSKEPNYQCIMENLFLYIMDTLELIVAENYVIIYFDGGCSPRNLPGFQWLRKCYQLINERLHKSLQHLCVVHASWYIRLLVAFFRPFISSKFYKKLILVPTLYKLADLVSLDSISIPDTVLEHDLQIQVKKSRSHSRHITR